MCTPKKITPSDKINIRAPHALQQDIIDLIDSNRSDYKDFSDFIIGVIEIYTCVFFLYHNH